MVTDHNNALIYTLEQAKTKVDISSDFIRQINGMAMKSTGGIINSMAGSYDSSKGDFRKSMIYEHWRRPELKTTLRFSETLCLANR